LLRIQTRQNGGRVGSCAQKALLTSVAAGETPAVPTKSRLLRENASDLVVGEAACPIELRTFALQAVYRIVFVAKRLRAKTIGILAAACDDSLTQIRIEIASKSTIDYRGGKYCGKKKALH
jgi:hypothetical protein